MKDYLRLRVFISNLDKFWQIEWVVPNKITNISSIGTLYNIYFTLYLIMFRASSDSICFFVKKRCLGIWVKLKKYRILAMRTNLMWLSYYHYHDKFNVFCKLFLCKEKRMLEHLNKIENVEFSQWEQVQNKGDFHTPAKYKSCSVNWLIKINWIYEFRAFTQWYWFCVCHFEFPRIAFVTINKR